MIFMALFILGLLCLCVWIVLLFVKPRQPFHEEVKTLVYTGKGQSGYELPKELTPKDLKRSLEFYSGNASALEKYVQGLRDRFDGYIEIKFIEQQVRKANVRKELADAVIAMLRSEREWQRLPQEEDLKDAQVKTQLLEEQAKQQEIVWRTEHENELRDAEHQYKVREFQKKTTDLDPKPTTPKPKPKPSPEEVLRSKLDKQKQIREQIQAEEKEELLRFRLEKRPDVSKEQDVYRDESVWFADWREIGGDQADFVLGEYENIKKWHKNRLNEALAALS